MKYLASLLVYFFQNHTAKRNLLLLLKFFLLIGTIVICFSVLFHVLMLYEGREYSWVTGLYWTLTVMSTLGFGDITFKTDLGLLFSIMVLSSGIIFLLIMLPFTFIQFFYEPWLEAQSRARAPLQLPKETKGHVILTNLDPITMNLIKNLKHHGYEYVLLVAELNKTLEYHDMGYKVVFGDPGDPETYERLRVRRAAMVVITNDDMMNTKISFTIREVCKDVPIITNADEDHSLDILQFAGATHIFQFMKMLGKALARRTLGLGAGTNVIGGFDQLLIVEAPAMHTPLEGKTLAAIRLRERTGISVVGVWARGIFTIPSAHTVIDSTMVLVMAGTAAQLKRYEEKYCFFCTDKSIDAPVLILGGGRVGLAAAVALEEKGINYKIIEKNPKVVLGAECVHGNAAEIDTLRRAGINEARSVLITTHEDAINLYLTIYCRQLRPDIQIISRANRERTISRLHSAGADLVMSSASMGANTIINLLKPGKVLTVAEGLNVFKSPLPDSLVGTNLGQSQVREKTSCSVIAIHSNGEFILNPASSRMFASGDELILIGTFEAEKRFLETY